MWQWLSLLPLILLVQTSLWLPLIPESSWGVPTSTGPTSDTEAALLWQQGVQALADAESSATEISTESLAKTQFQDAINSFQRLVDRYPSSPHYLLAHYYLGKAYRGANQPAKAIEPLRYCMNSTAVEKATVLRCQLELGRTYLSMNRFHEAKLSTHGTETLLTQASDIPLFISQELQFVKIHALLALKQDAQAAHLLQKALTQTSENSPRQIKGQASLLQLKVKLKECSHLPSQKSLDEAQVQNQLDRRGTCLLEALVFLNKTLTTDDLPSARFASLDAQSAIDAYRSLCKNPPRDLLKAPKHLTRKEKNKAHAELTDLLIQECNKKSQAALELLEGWESEIPSRMNPFLDDVRQSLKTLSKS